MTKLNLIKIEDIIAAYTKFTGKSIVHWHGMGYIIDDAPDMNADEWDKYRENVLDKLVPGLDIRENAQEYFDGTGEAIFDTEEDAWKFFNSIDERIYATIYFDGKLRSENT